MTFLYQAKVTTHQGSYRAFVLGGLFVAITEDGVDGLVDCFEMGDDDTVIVSPEWLLELLRSWVFECRRGEVITSTSLRRIDS